MISLIIPFGSTDPRRQAIFDWVLARWEWQFPDWQICLGSSDLEDFNRAEARNRAFEQAEGDVIVISDADTFTTVENVENAIKIVRSSDYWVIAHRTYYSLTDIFTDYLLHDTGPKVDIEREQPVESNWKMLNRSQAGVLVMSREAYLTVGGYDERFKGWGYEDLEFSARMDTKWHPHVRTAGDMYHLWHDPGLNFKQPNIKFNEDLYRAEAGHGHVPV